MEDNIWGFPSLVRRERLRLRSFILLLVLVAPTAGANEPQDCSDVGISIYNDSCGRLLSVAVFGDASGVDCRMEDVCLTISGTGDATNYGGDVDCGSHGIAGLTAGPGVNCVAISGTGNASNRVGRDGCGAPHGLGVVTVSCLAVSGTGSASNGAGQQSCGSPQQALSVGCIAVSGTGNASNSAGPASCGSPVGGGPVGGAAVGIGCIALSLRGSAWNDAGDGSCGDSRGTAVGLGCIAQTLP